MNQNVNENKKTEYEVIRNTSIKNERFNPFNVILPLLIGVLIISILALYSINQRNTIIRNTEQVTNQMAEYVAANISNLIDYGYSSINFSAIAAAQSMSSGVLENPEEVFDAMISDTPFAGIEYIQSDGMNVMNIGEPFDASDRVYYIEGIKGNRGVWNNYHPKTSEETLMNFYTPLIYDGEISGVITGYIATSSQVVPLFVNKLYGQPIYGLLVDENDMVICSTIESEYVNDMTLDIFMDNFGATDSQKNKVRDVINGASEKATSHMDQSGGGRLCVVKIPDTDWTVAIIVPSDSFNLIISDNTKDSLYTIMGVSSILLAYAAFVLVRNIKRRKDIAAENKKLEEENQYYNEINQKAFSEIEEIRDINASAHMGTWRIDLVDGFEPCMYVDNTMKALLGLSGKDRTPEETYTDWFSNITPNAVASVLGSVEKMKNGKFDENTYLWNHPTKGERYVRCGGTAQKIDGGYSLRGYHYDVDEVVREDMAQVAMLENAVNEKNDFYSTLGTVAGIFNSLHVIDITSDTVIEYSARDMVRDIVNRKEGATEMMNQVMTALVTEDSIKKALEFTDLTTLSERMKNKKYISSQLISKQIGWFIATFITMEADKEGFATKVVFTTRSIDEEKKQEQKLINESQTDELTGLLNRRAYEEGIYNHNDIPTEEYFVSISLDVNGLKIVNDTLGHQAGDELLIGASRCMLQSFAPYGKVYRTGGDEFIAILFVDDKKLQEILEDFDDTVANWTGDTLDSLTISYGWVSKEEEPGLSVRELGVIADQRMYDAKAAHYKKMGVDRRGQQDAHRALCELYTKILKINITDDTYQIINMDVSEQTKEKGFAEKISVWLSEFGTSGQVHPDDLEEYLRETDIQYMKDYFSSEKTSLSIFYRRKYGDVFKQVMMEIIPALDYSLTNQSLYLYVKDIDK